MGNISEQPKREYKEVTCSKCGFVHSSNDKECPNCGYSKFREVSKIVLTLTIILGIIVSLCFLFIKVNNLETRLTNLENALTNIDQTSDSVSITSLDYFQKQLIKDGDNLKELPANANGEYLIYAMQYDCSACEEANVYVYDFLAAGYPDYIPVYFITPEEAPTIFDEQLNCEATPTLYRVKDGEIVNSQVGVDEVYYMFDEIVKEANSSISE